MPSAGIFKPKNGDVTFLLNISVFYSSLHGVIIIFIPFHKSSHRYCTYHEHVKMVTAHERVLFLPQYIMAWIILLHRAHVPWIYENISFVCWKPQMRGRKCIWPGKFLGPRAKSMFKWIECNLISAVHFWNGFNGSVLRLYLYWNWKKTLCCLNPIKPSVCSAYLTKPKISYPVASKVHQEA
jgi:hypothetical protein